ncbi:MAG: F0F1 ATP synthase subunit epsilon [Bacteroidales bacterium]|nr:F0F1 ATP synthase subunit epsilon [Bacteroidales bacterium]
MTNVIALHIVSPEGTLVETEVSAVTLPGSLAPFEVLKDHAPLISSLDRGDIVYVDENGEQRLPIASGFVEVLDNQVEVCVEV